MVQVCQPTRILGRRAGFSLVELSIVVVILGVLATFAVPRYTRSVERSKAGEAFSFLRTLVSAQEAYNARGGRYSNAIGQLDAQMKTPKYFAVGRLTSSNWQTRWRLILTRSGADSGYGPYTVVFDETGFNRGRSSIPDELIPNL
jgi:prepilin-type N-terminal cleavage/methylation domain-containing protein